MKDYNTAYNALANATTLAAGELASDGYEAAYTAVKGDDTGTGSDLYTGKCTTGTGGTAVLMSMTDGVDYTNTNQMTLLWDAVSADSDIGDSTATAGASVCAKRCSALAHWGVDPTSNLPYTYLPDSGTSTLTSSDAAASTNSLTTMGGTSCLGFEIEVAGATGADNLKCK
jgi:hypothetical protein